MNGISLMSQQVLGILPFGMVCLSAIRMMFGNILLAVCWWVLWSELKQTLVSSVNCVQSAFM